jgi:hypothetical protein
MRTVGRIRHKAYLRLAIADVVTGAESLGEIDLAHLCRKFGLVALTRQSRRKDASEGGDIWIRSGICRTARSSYWKSTVDIILRWRIGRLT